MRSDRVIHPRLPDTFDCGDVDHRSCHHRLPLFPCSRSLLQRQGADALTAARRTSNRRAFMAIDDFAIRALACRQAAGLTRLLRRIDGPQDTWITVDGQRALLLCSNNYLGLANDAAVCEAAQRAA